MKTSQYISRKIKALTADKQENLQAPLFEELSDSETSIIGGGEKDKTLWKPPTINLKLVKVVYDISPVCGFYIASSGEAVCGCRTEPQTIKKQLG